MSSRWGNLSAARLQALDEFIRAHPGTLAAAKALYQKGFQLASGNVYPDYEARGGDPTDRFFRVLDLVTELESGKYPSSEWVDRAPTLVTHFFADGPSYAPGNIERMLEGYTSFLKTHFELSQLDAARDGIGFIVSYKIADLCARKGERTAGVERVLTELEREIEDVSAVRYLRAAFYISSMNEHAGERLALYQKAIGALRTLAAQGNGHYHRKALATLASLYFSERDYPNARAHFKKYLAAFPHTEWAWIAALRVGQSEEALGEWKLAVQAYTTAAAPYASVPMARVLGHSYAARGYDALGDFARARIEYESALAGWDSDYGLVSSLHASHPAKPGDQSPLADDPGISRQDLADRVAELRVSLGAPGGLLLERGRWLVERGRHREARAPLAQLLEQHARSTLVPDARYLLNQVKVDAALELAAAGRRKRDEPAALAALTAITRSPYDFGVFAARDRPCVVTTSRRTIGGRIDDAERSDGTRRSPGATASAPSSGARGRYRRNSQRRRPAQG